MRLYAVAGCQLVVIALSALGGRAPAQVPRGADTLSASAVRDSQRVLAEIKAVIAKNPRNAPAWLRQGMVAWALYVRAGTNPRIKGLDETRLRRLADTSLRIAVQLEPRNAIYHLTMGTFLRHATEATTRFASMAFLDKALDLARFTTDSAFHATAAIEAGRIRWLRYDTNPHRMPPCALLSPNIDSASITPIGARIDAPYAFKVLHNQLMNCFGTYKTFESGDYITAETLFREALRFGGRDDRPFRHLAMVLLERKRWMELESLARERIKSVPEDPWGILALGLAQHRGGKSAAATASFDSGAARLSPPERLRLFAFTRLLTPMDSAAYGRGSSDEREARERAEWTVVMPLWSRPGGDPRTEFMARVVFAELRWTVDELDVRGADSNRGEMHIRYGPPERVYGLRGCDFYPNMPSYNPFRPAGCNPLIDLPPGTGTQLPPLTSVITYWDYDNGLTLVFWGSPTYGTAYIPAADNGHVAAAVDLRPASFDNMARETILDIPSRTARFRGPADSVDLLMTMRAPVADIRSASSLDAPARIDFWMYPRDRTTGREYRDSAAMRGSGVGRWVYRLPNNEYFYRVEATADGSMTAARTVGWVTAGRDTVTGFSTRGFGMSDVVMATDARPNKPSPARWTDFSVAPLITEIAKGGTLYLIWENYELAARDGQSNYTIEITLERKRGLAGRIGAAVANALASVVGVDHKPDRSTYTFARGVSQSNTVVDMISVELRDTPDGDYQLTVAITDKHSGRRTKATTAFAIRD
jgi:hypothetical protein